MPAQLDATTIGREGVIGGIVSLGHTPAFARGLVQVSGQAARIAIARLEITLTYVEAKGGCRWQLTPLPLLLKRVLSLLGLSSKVYTRLAHNSG